MNDLRIVIRLLVVHSQHFFFERNVKWLSWLYRKLFVTYIPGNFFLPALIKCVWMKLSRAEAAPHLLYSQLSSLLLPGAPD